MRHKKSLLAAVGAIAATALALTGCSSGSGSSPTSTAGAHETISVWMYPVISDATQNQDYWNKIVASFEKAHPNITVDLTNYPWANRDTQIQTAIAAGKAPNLLYLTPSELGAFAGDIVPMSGYLPASQRSAMLPSALKAVTLNGKLLGSPILISTNTLMCDKKAFEAAGVTSYPKTWSDLMKEAPTFKKHGIYATIYSATAEQTLYETFYPLLWQAGGDVYNESGTKVTIDSAAGRKALQFITTMAKDGYIPQSAISTNLTAQQTPLATNQVACTYQNVPTDVQQYWGTKNIVILPPLKDVKAVSYGNVGSIAMLKSSSGKEQASGEFAAYITNYQNSKSFDLASGYFSPYTAGSGIYKGNAVQSALAKTIPYTYAGQLEPSARAIMAVISPPIQAALLGQMTPSQALEKAATQAQALIASSN